MAEKLILENFEEFAGLDLSSTALTRKPTAFRTLTNTRFGEGGSLRKRPGYQKIGQAALFEKIHSYKYQDTLSGETQEELLAINNYLWRLKEGSFTITGGTALAATVSFVSGTPRLVITNSGTPLTISGNPYIDLTISVGSLIEAIDANAAVACTPLASMKWAKVTSSTTNLTSITVAAGYTYAIGDWLSFTDATSSDLRAFKVSSLPSATTIAMYGVYSTTSVGYIGALEVSSGTIATGTYTGTTTLTIPFSYWEPVPFVTAYNYRGVDASDVGDLTLPFDKNSFSNTNPIRPCFLNAYNVCYIYYGTDSTVEEPFRGYPFKYDGIALYREGNPKALPCVTNPLAGSLTGVYQYKYSFITYDARGNVIEGQISEAVSRTLSAQKAFIEFYNPSVASETLVSLAATVNGNQTSSSITVNAGHTLKAGQLCILESGEVMRVVSTTATVIVFPRSITVSNGDYMVYVKDGLGFNTRGAVVNGAQSSVSSITVDAATNFVEVGDIILIQDTLRTGIPVTTRIVTTKTATTIGWAVGDVVSVADNAYISAGIRIRLYRTKAGGNVFYKVTEVPLAYDVSIQVTSYTDDAADSTLVERLIEPEIGFEPTIPPKARFATVHQGVRVAAGIYPGAGSVTGENEGNTVAIYDPINIESVPIGSGQNYIDLPSNVKGSLSALASDNDNSLAVFKANAYYAINGDILGGGASINTITEGDYGIASHNSIKKINGAIFGVGTLGVLVVSNGQILTDVSNKINSVIRNNKLLKISAAEAENDYFNMGYAVHVPHNTSTASVSDSKTFFFDYETNIWLEDSWSLSGCYPVGGITMHEDRQYFMGSGVAYRELRQDSVLTTLAEVYADHGTAIARVMRFIYHLGTPSIDKEFLRFKLYSMYNPGETSEFVTSTPTIKTYRDFQTSTVDSELTLAFTNSSIFEADKKLRENKDRAMEFEIIDSTINECLHLTGWEILVDDGFRKEDLK